MKSVAYLEFHLQRYFEKLVDCCYIRMLTLAYASSLVRNLANL
jgi:hypothetical protein